MPLVLLEHLIVLEHVLEMLADDAIVLSLCLCPDQQHIEDTRYFVVQPSQLRVFSPLDEGFDEHGHRQNNEPEVSVHGTVLLSSGH